jgi:chromosomal replication initiation ATPase DnaA
MEELVNELKVSMRSHCQNIIDEVELIKLEVCNKLNLTVDDINSTSRKTKIVHARQIASYLLLQKGYGLSEVGKKMNNLDHSTVIHSRDSINDTTIKTDKVFYGRLKMFGIR